MDHEFYHEQIERLAYQLWEERGRPAGSPDDDWFRANEILSDQEMNRLPFSSVAMGPVE